MFLKFLFFFKSQLIRLARNMKNVTRNIIRDTCLQTASLCVSVVIQTLSTHQTSFTPATGSVATWKNILTPACLNKMFTRHTGKDWGAEYAHKLLRQSYNSSKHLLFS